MSSFQVPIRLLLVDDEAEFLDSTARALRRRDFEVTTAKDGETALAVLSAEEFDVAVLDVKMPGLQGDELFQILSQRWPDLPVILLTGHGSLSQAFQTSKQGVFDYLIKPCSIDKLADMARQAAGLGVGRQGPATHARVRSDPPQQEEDEIQEIRLLLVDDEPDFLRGLALGLRRRGIATATAAGGAQALDLAALQLFDVAVIDLRMPGLGGLELLEKLKECQPSMQVVLLTGQPTVGTVRLALNRGAFDYLLKPHDMDTLVAKIRAASFRSQEVRTAHRAAAVEDILTQHPD